MTRVILHGCFGAMGRAVTAMAAEDDDITIAAGVDAAAGPDPGYPVYPSLAECKEEADVVIDFSVAPAMDRLLADMRDRRIGGVICTTGLSEEQIEAILALSHDVPMLRSANMSVGINLIQKVLRMITPVLAESGFDMEIVEMHHHRKVDAPSGTALALAETMQQSMKEAAGEDYTLTLDRSAVRKKREPKEIGIQALRGGTVPGVHEIIFAGTDEVIRIDHTAYSRVIFARGALSAAKFLQGKDAGLYDMSDVIG